MTVNDPAGVNPYLAGRGGHLEAHARYVIAARNWRWTGILALLVAALSVAGMIMVATQSQVVPYVVKVDKLGEAVPVGRADRAAKPNKAVIVAQLARWITAVRSVWVDAGAQRGLVKAAWEHPGDPHLSDTGDEVIAELLQRWLAPRLLARGTTP